MSLDPKNFGEHIIRYPITAGICDNCECPEMINVGGDDEPQYMELYCSKKKIIIEPQPPEHVMTECDFFIKK